MSHPIKKTGIYKDIPSSRYYGHTTMYYSEKNYITLELYKKKKTATDVWTDIPRVYEYRPDKMSNEIYGTPDFWWRLMEANNMKDIMEFKTGVNIRVPKKVL